LLLLLYFYFGHEQELFVDLALGEAMRLLFLVIRYRLFVDELVKNPKTPFSVIPAEAGIQEYQEVLAPGACPRPDPGFAGVTALMTFCEAVICWLSPFTGHSSLLIGVIHLRRDCLERRKSLLGGCLWEKLELSV